MASTKAPLINITDPAIRQPPPGQVRAYPSPTRTGKVPFSPPSHPDLHLETWYALYGTLTQDSVPLVVLHGGPGAGHNHLKTVSLLSKGPHARPVILYDQVGCGNSTLLPSRRGDDDLWQPELFMAELDNLVRHLLPGPAGTRSFDVLGQSWGGMLAAQYAAARSGDENVAAVRRLVLCDSPSDMPTWTAVANELRGLLPEDVQETLRRCEENGETDGPEYEGAVMEFYKLFVCRVDPISKELLESMEVIRADDTVYYTMVSWTVPRRSLLTFESMSGGDQLTFCAEWSF